MPDIFGPARTFESPAYDAFAITPADSGELDVWTRAVYVGVGGNIAAVMASGNVVTFTGVPQGVVLPIRVQRINSTGTTASSLIGLA